MPTFIPIKGRLILLGLIALVGGCETQDAELLARIGRKVMTRAEAAVADPDRKLAQSWLKLLGQSAQANVTAEITLGERVKSRLRWDKTLKELVIEVTEKDGVVELRGTVREEGQKTRAVEIAESTAGVMQIEDKLELTPPDPGDGAKDG